MAFETVADLGCDTTVRLGGRDKETGKLNPTSIEGYYLGFRTTDSKFGPGKLHILQTAKGNVGVWGKTNMDQKLAGVIHGCCVRITFDGTVPTNKGNDMLKFKVEVDRNNCINVDNLAAADDASSPSYEDAANDEEEETNLDAEDTSLDEVTYTSTKRPSSAAPVQQTRTQQLLGGKNKAKTA